MTSGRPAADAFSPIVTGSNWGGRATRAEIDLDAIAWNVRELAGRASGKALMTVVKANAYGHGALEVARTALLSGASWLGVYTVDEGAQLRRGGITARILVFGPFTPAEAALVARWKLTPTVTHQEAAKWLQEAAAEKPLRVHLKVDTGLSRAGVAPENAVALWESVRSMPKLVLEGVYTHLARADEPNREFTYEQLRVFENVCRALRAAGAPFTIRHAANSAGTIEFSEAHFDMVRCGISTYGYRPSADVTRPIALRPALKLLSSVARVHWIAPGTGVGYGHEFRCNRPTCIALVPIGYGDGLPRSLGNGKGRVIVSGALVPIVGRVSMDQITLDVTDVPEVAVGSHVVLIGSQGKQSVTAEDVGAWAGTISYDILTGLMPRVPRLYVQDGRILGMGAE